MSPPADRSGQHHAEQQQAAAAANSHLQRSFSAATARPEPGQFCPEWRWRWGNGDREENGFSVQVAGWWISTLLTRHAVSWSAKQPLSLIASERGRPRLSTQVEWIVGESGNREGGEELLSPDSHSKMVDEVVAGVIPGDDGGLLEQDEYRRGLTHEDMQLPASRMEEGEQDRKKHCCCHAKRSTQMRAVTIPRGSDKEWRWGRRGAASSTCRSWWRVSHWVHQRLFDETSDVTSQAEGVTR